MLGRWTYYVNNKSIKKKKKNLNVTTAVVDRIVVLQFIWYSYSCHTIVVIPEILPRSDQISNVPLHPSYLWYFEICKYTPITLLQVSLCSPLCAALLQSAEMSVHCPIISAILSTRQMTWVFPSAVNLS